MKQHIMMSQMIVVVFAFVCTHAYCQTKSMVILNDTTWDGNININSHVQIADATLTIMPGTVINFQGTYAITVSGTGTILANGAVNDTIVFTAQNHTNGWSGIKIINRISNEDSIRFEYCKFQYGISNEGENGGAIHISNSRPIVFNNCMFCNNKTSDGVYYWEYCTPAGQGGAIAIINHSTCSFSYCQFKNNFTGSGAYIGSQYYWEGCIEGGAGGGGGAIFISESSNATIRNCDFLNNITGNGGTAWCNDGLLIWDYSGCGGNGAAICVEDASEISITNSFFAGNITGQGGGWEAHDGSGGGISIYSQSSGIMQNCLFANNIAGTGDYYYSGTGGGINVGGNQCDVSITNCLIYNNFASSGGGIYSENNAKIILVGNTIANNKSSGYGGGAYLSDTSMVINSIFWSNHSNAGSNELKVIGNANQVSFCAIQGGYTGVGAGEGIINLDGVNTNANGPKFILPTSMDGINPTSPAWQDANWHLPFHSVCVNSGVQDTTGLLIPGTDYEGNPRISGPRSDIGAFEFQEPNPQLFLNLNAGWNLVSFDVLPDLNAPEMVFAPLITDGNLLRVTGYQNQTEVFFDPSGPPILNTLQNLVPGEGYWIKLINPTTLIIAGEPVPSGFGMDLYTGWNLIGYWPYDFDVTTPEEAFAQLISSGILLMVTGFDHGGKYFDPNGPEFLNTLTEIKTGSGYWVKLSTDFPNFIYPNNPWECGDSLFEPRDSRSYSTVQIGAQCWMKENLNIGTLINSSQETSDNEVIEKYCYDENPDNCDIYGGLYDWDEMMQYNANTQSSIGVCPPNGGWHLPTDNEWTVLINYLGGENNAGGLIKEAGTLHWLPPNTGATNSSGFTGLPGGVLAKIDDENIFVLVGEAGYWWSSTLQDYSNAWLRSLETSTTFVNHNSNPIQFGLSVRCVKNN